MRRHDYPNVYPPLRPEDARELKQRKVLLIDRHVAEEVLEPETCLAILEKAYKEEGMGSAVNRTKANILVPTPDPNTWYRYCSMEGGIRGLEVAAIRIKSDMVSHYSPFGKARVDWQCGFPGRFFGLILLFSAKDGTLLAMLHDGHIQHMRVAATVTLATRHMARQDSRVLAILGSGGMAWTHAFFLSMVRNIQKIRVYSPNPEHRKRFAQQVQEALEIETVATDEPRAAVQGSDIVAVCTNAAEPALLGEWLEKGMHLIITKPSGVEMDETGWRRLDKYVVYESPPGVQGSPSETRWTAPPDWRFAGGTTGELMEQRRTLIGSKKIDTLPDLLLGRVTGRDSEEQITATCNEGTGVQFAAVALKVYEEAKARGLGREMPLDWFLQDVTN
ncbi:MAG: hypothetical protein V3T60_04015 [Candidatus Binatia bacterium]